MHTTRKLNLLPFGFAQEGFMFLNLEGHHQGNQQTSEKSWNIEATSVVLTLYRV
jgi:hypothetical protein